MHPLHSPSYLSLPRLAWLLVLLFFAGLAACGPASSGNAPNLEPGASIGDLPMSPKGSILGTDQINLVTIPSPTSAARDASARPDEPLVVPEWIATGLASPDVHVRLHVLDRWVQQDRTGSVDPLMLALNDPNERVRTRALQLIEQDWAKAAEK